MQKFRMNNKGVSTIIAAALIVALTVVLAVALGSTVLQVSTPSKTYQLQLKGEAQYDGNIVLTNMGGDPISLDSVKISYYIPSGTFAGMQEDIPVSVWSASDGKFEYGAWSGVFDAGDTITMGFRDVFDRPGYLPGSHIEPAAGEQFVVTLYIDSQPVASSTIIVKP